jgi:hypothetical protein
MTGEEIARIIGKLRPLAMTEPIAQGLGYLLRQEPEHQFSHVDAMVMALGLALDQKRVLETQMTEIVKRTNVAMRWGSDG